MKSFGKLGKLFKWVGFTILMNILIIVIAAVIVLANPDWIVNEKVLRFLADLARQNQIADVDWGHASAHIESKFLTPRSFNFNFQNLCIASPSKEQQACWKNAGLSFKVGFSNYRPKITEIGPIKLVEGELTFTSAKLFQPAEPPLSLSDQLLKVSEFMGALKDISFHSIYVLLHHERAKFVFEAEGDQLKIAAELKNWALGGGQVVSGGLHLSAVAKLNQAQIDAQLSGRLLGPLKHRKTLSASLDGQILDLMNFDKIQLKIDADGRKLFSEVSAAGLSHCALKLHRIDSRPFAGNIKFDCPVWVALPPKLEDKYKFNLPGRAFFRVLSEFRSSEYPVSPASQLQGWASLELDPLAAPWLKGEGKVKMEFNGVPQKFPDGWKADSEAALTLIHSGSARNEAHDCLAASSSVWATT